MAFFAQGTPALLKKECHLEKEGNPSIHAGVVASLVH